MDKKVVFTEEIDRAFNGFALSITFIGFGIFLLLKPEFLFTPIISSVFGAIIGLFGMIGAGIELSRCTKIKGLDNLAVGIVFLLIGVVVHILLDYILVTIFCFLAIIFGVYGFVLGMIQGVYSTIQNAKEKSKSGTIIKAELAGQAILLITEICSLAVAVLNLIQAANITR